MQTQRIIRLLFSLLVLIALLVDAADLYQYPFLPKLENWTYDARLNFTRPDSVDDSVVIIDIDETSLAKVGRFDEALELIRKDNVLPGICGRICTHPCESACRRGEVDAPLAIRDIKRYVADHGSVRHDGPGSRKNNSRSEHIAVIGSGPAGLAAAMDLVRRGFNVTIFEKEKE